MYIARTFKASRDSIILTFDGSDTKVESLEFQVRYIDYVDPRKFLPLLRMLPSINAQVEKQKFSYVASTGAAIAIIGYFISRMKRLPFYYVEIVARQYTHSLTARILKVLGVGQIFVQSPFLQSASNVYLAHPITDYTIVKSKSIQMIEGKRIFVAFGTIQGFDFTRGVELAKSVMNDSDSIEWQVGYTNVGDLPGVTHEKLDRNDFLKSISNADVVICHGGIGVITDCLRAGRVPLVIPRRKSFGEHVDNHQVEIIEFLAQKGLVVNLENNNERSVIDEVLTKRVINDKNLL